jgi:hypothetical protein
MPCRVDVHDTAPIVCEDDEDEQDGAAAGAHVRVRQVSVGTAKKSTVTFEPRWFLRNVRQL